MVLCVDVAEPCAWLATPDGSQRHRINISMTQVRGLHKAGLITTRRDRNAIYTTFVISAKGQAEVRRIKHRQSQLLTKPSALIDARIKEERPKHQGKSKLRGNSEAVSAPRSARDELRQAVERARKSGSLIVVES
jgi:DNA-binding PadR family transcriptional regulator